MKASKRVQKIFDLALKPPPVSDPDPGNPVPYSIRKDIPQYRLGFYAIVIVLSILVLTIPRTILYDPVTEQFDFERSIYGVILLFFVILCHYFVTGSDPGYLPVAVAVKLGDDFASKAEAEQEFKKFEESFSAKRVHSREIIIRSPDPYKVKPKVKKKVKKQSKEKRQLKQGNKNEESEEEKENYDTDVSMESDLEIQLETSRLVDHEEGSDENEDFIQNEEEPNEQLDEYIAGVPIQRLPIRSKFCRKSSLIVATYDHHCGVLNTTIGERNRARFWFLLLFSTFLISWTLVVIHSGFRNSHANVTAWFERNGHCLIAAIIFWMMLFLFGGLFVFHTFLMLANVTTYEFMRSDKIHYLNHTRDFDLPFSMGLLNNIHFYFMSDAGIRNLYDKLSGSNKEWRPHIWEYPPEKFDRESKDVCKNLWENRYWSCC